MSVTPETLYDAVQAEIAKYPNRRGAMLPALHLTQEAYGWLSPEALTACSDAIGFSPAYCQAVASFYDMFFLEPVGTHVIDVCTNLACALRGAGDVLEAFEGELGVSVGGTTDDGTITLRKAECRVDGGVAVPIPHRPGRADFPHPVLHERDSLAAA